MLAEAGVKAFAVLNFTYTSANEVVDIDYVRVRKADGTVVKTPDYNIQDMPGEVTRTAPLYSDIHEKHIAVKGVGCGRCAGVSSPVSRCEAAGSWTFLVRVFFRQRVRSPKTSELEISIPSRKIRQGRQSRFQAGDQGGRDAARSITWKHANLDSNRERSERGAAANSAEPGRAGDDLRQLGRQLAAGTESLQKDPLRATPRPFRRRPQN